LLERHFQTAGGDLRLGGVQAGGFRRDRAFAVVEQNFRRRFRNGFHHAQPMLRMAHVLADVQRFDFHAENLAQFCSRKNFYRAKSSPFFVGGNFFRNFAFRAR